MERVGTTKGVMVLRLTNQVCGHRRPAEGIGIVTLSTEATFELSLAPA